MKRRRVTRVGRRLDSREVSLRVLQDEDVDSVVAFHNDLELKHATMGWPLPVSRSKVRAWVDRLSRADDEVLLGIIEKPRRRLIGVVRLMKVDWRHRKCELGVYIGDRTRRRKGVGKRSLNLLLDWAFANLGLHRVFLRVSADNTPAIRAFKSLGFRPEGELREDVFQAGVYQNVLVMGLLAREHRSGAYVKK